MFPLANPAGTFVVPGKLKANCGVEFAAGSSAAFYRPDGTYYFKNSYGVNDTLLRWNYCGGATLMSLDSSGNVVVAGGLNAATLASASFTAHNVLIGQGASAVTSAAPGVVGTVLMSNGTTSDPTFQDPGTAGQGLITKLAQVITAGSQATVSFSSIPATYSNLMIVAQGRDTTAGTSDSNVFIKFNGDGTSGNYDGPEALAVTSTTVGGAQPAVSANGFVILTQPNDGATAGRASAGQIIIPAYARTTFFKQALSTNYSADGTSTAQTLQVRGGEWKSTAAINAIVLTAGTAFKDGSVFTLYGMP